MQSKHCIALFFTLCLATHFLSAQEEKGTWQFGIGTGANLFRHPQQSLNYTFIGDKYFEAKQENSIGYQGNLAASYRVHRVMELHGAVGISKLKTLTTTNSLSIIDSVITHEIIDQQYLMLEVPAFFRIHLRQKKPPKYGVYAFLELGLIYYTPLANNSNYQRRENGALVESRSMGMSGLSRTGGIGLAIGTKNTLAFNFASFKNDRPDLSYSRKLTFTRFFYSTKVKNGPSGG